MHLVFLQGYAPNPLLIHHKHTAVTAVSTGTESCNLMVWSQQTSKGNLPKVTQLQWWSRVGLEQLNSVILTIMHYRLANSVYWVLVKEL